MKNKVLEIVSRLQKEADEAKIAPNHVLQSTLFNAVIKEVKGAINELYKENKIEVIETINQKTFKVK